MNKPIPDPPAERIQPVRKQITVLFCDIVDYTSRSASMDPEDLADEIWVFQTICTRIAEKHGGNICDYLGDGLMILFGHPQAGEFDPGNAILAAREMNAEIRKNNKCPQWKKKSPLRLRTGIATGLVLVGDRAGMNRDRNELVFGVAPALAARLQSLADPETIVVSASTRELSGSVFRFRDLGEQDLKGFADPVPAYEVLGLSRRRHSARHATRSLESRFVSRKEELQILQQGFLATRKGVSSVFRIHGEAGIGKSRLVREFLHSINEQKVTRLRIHCSPWSRNSPLRIVVDEVRRWFRIRSGDDRQAIERKIRKALTGFPVADGNFQEILSEILCADNSTKSVTGNLGPLARYRERIRCLSWLLFHLSKSRPTILIVEDLHWSDPTTLDLLEHIVDQAHGQRLFAIFTSRPDFSPPWNEPGAVTPIPLPHLDPEESVRMILSLFRDSTPDPAIQEALAGQCDGIPLFIEECSRATIASMTDRDDQDSGAAGMSIPETLQDSLNSRLDQLGAAKELAQAASVFGTSFMRRDLEHIAGLNEIDSSDNLAALLAAGILRTRHGSGSGKLKFNHAMIRDAAYQSMLRKNKQRIHRQLAELLISRNPEILREQPELLAYHYSRTDQPDTAIGLWIRASDIAIQRSAIIEAIHHADCGLELADDQDDSDKNRKFRLHLLLNRAACLTLRSGYYGSTVISTYKECIVLAAQAGTREQRYSALFGYWRCLVCQAAFGRALKVSAKLKVLGEKVGEPALQGISLGVHGVTRTFFGKFRGADRYYQQAEILFDCQPGNDPASCSGQHPCFTVQSIRAINDLIRHDSPDARFAQRDSLDQARSTDNPYTIAECLKYSAMHAQLRADPRALRDFAGEGKDLSRRNGFEGLISTFNILLAYSDVILFRNIKAFDTLCRNLQNYHHNFALLHYPYFVGLLAQCCLHMNQYQQAMTQSNQALLLVDRYGEKWIRSALLLCKAEAAAMGVLADPDAIADWYQEAELTAAQQDAALFLKSIRQSRRLTERERFRQNMLCNSVYEPEPGVLDFELLDVASQFSLTDHSFQSADI